MLGRYSFPCSVQSDFKAGRCETLQAKVWSKKMLSLLIYPIWDLVVSCKFSNFQVCIILYRLNHVYRRARLQYTIPPESSRVSRVRQKQLLIIVYRPVAIE